MSSYREDCNKAKAVRRGVEEQRPNTPKVPKKKTVRVDFRLKPRDLENLPTLSKWSKWGMYRTADEAQTMIDRELKKNPHLWEFRIIEPKK